MDDFAKFLNDGTTQQGEQSRTTDIVFRSGRAKVVVNTAKEFITLTHLRPGKA